MAPGPMRVPTVAVPTEAEDIEPVAEEAADQGVVGAVEEVAAAIAETGPAGQAQSSSSSGGPSPVGLNVPHVSPAVGVEKSTPDGSVTISGVGYVRSSLPQFAEVPTLGLVCRYRDGRTVCANCHLHPRCAIKVSVFREPVEDLRLAQWLATGEVCAGLPWDESLAMGAVHRSR